jgi:hypothetical protein
MVQNRPRRPELPIGDTMRDALAAGLQSARDLGTATTLAFLVVLAKEAAHTVLVDPTQPVRFQPDVFLVDLAATILLAPYWMAMFRRILGAGGSLSEIVAGRAGPFQTFLALELFWLLVGSALGRALSADGAGQASTIVTAAGFLAWIGVLTLQIWTGLLAPALAVDAPDATLRGVFAMTRGSAARLGLILVSAILPLGLLDRMLSAPERAGVGVPPLVVAFRIVASSLIEMAMLALVTALLAEGYRRLRPADSLIPRP